MSAGGRAPRTPHGASGCGGWVVRLGPPGLACLRLRIAWRHEPGLGARNSEPHRDARTGAIPAESPLDRWPHAGKRVMRQSRSTWPGSVAANAPGLRQRSSEQGFHDRQRSLRPTGDRVYGMCSGAVGWCMGACI
jgi:hypothetical protein